MRLATQLNIEKYRRITGETFIVFPNNTGPADPSSNEAQNKLMHQYEVNIIAITCTQNGNGVWKINKYNSICDDDCKYTNNMQEYKYGNKVM